MEFPFCSDLVQDGISAKPEMPSGPLYFNFSSSTKDYAILEHSDHQRYFAYLIQ
jgi:hypothetical protein